MTIEIVKKALELANKFSKKLLKKHLTGFSLIYSLNEKKLMLINIDTRRTFYKLNIVRKDLF